MSKLWHINIRGLQTNFECLKSSLLLEKPAIVFVSETFLSDVILDAVVCIPGYVMLRKDRAGRFGGGLVIYISQFLKYKRIDSFETAEFESIWFELALEVATVLVCYVYLPESANLPILSQIESCLESYDVKSDSFTLLLGDFNCHNSEWLPTARTDTAGRRVLEFCNRNGFSQLVKDPTRYPDSTSSNTAPSLLDLVMTDNSEIITPVAVKAPIGTSDHCLLEFEIKSQHPQTTEDESNETCFRDFENVSNWPDVVAAAEQLPWHDIFSCSCPERAAELFGSFVNNLVEEFVPLRRFSRDQKLPYLTADFRKYSELKKSSWNRYKRCLSDYDLLEFRKYRDLLRREISRIKTESYRRTAAKIANSSSAKEYWKLARRTYKFSDNSNLIPELKHNGTVASTTAEKCDLLNEFYAESQTEVNKSFPSLPCPTTTPIFSDVHITADVVLNKLSLLTAGKSSGLDGISNTMLKNCAAVFAKPLSYVFRLCIDSCCMPHCWKSARVTMLYKGKGDRSSPKSYRPISVASCLGKILEDIVNENLVKHLLDNDLIHESQFGFLKGHSSCDQLLLMYDFWTRSVELKKTAVAAFLDLSNAFGCVPHNAIRSILPAFGVRGKLFGWFSSYLTERTQSTNMGNVSSSLRDVLAGVPQGSVVAPTLFIMFINSLLLDIDHFKDQNSAVQISSAAYADDTLITVSHEDPLVASVLLENLLETCAAWSKTWGMTFNPKKTVCMRFSSKRSSVDCPNSIQFMETVLPFSDEHVHLGIIISADLKFNAHVTEICKRLSKQLYVLRLVRKNLPDQRDLLLSLYKAYVRPHAEYCSPLLVGMGKTLSDHLESLQRKAMRIILGRDYRSPVSESDYLDLSLDQLSYRRNFALSCCTFKLWKGMTPRALLPYQPSLAVTPYSIRRDRFVPNHDVTVRLPYSERYRRSPLSLAIELMNLIGADNFYVPCMNSFKRCLCNFRLHSKFVNFPNI